uniref:Protochlorophyllide reductase n=1 Tax=Odontella aurita TaxID=265563 RepID=A0A7S4HRJ3_9STRA
MPTTPRALLCAVAACLVLPGMIGVAECFSPLHQRLTSSRTTPTVAATHSPISDEDSPSEGVPEDISRRSILASSAGVALSSLLLGSGSLSSFAPPAIAGVPPDYGTDKRTVVLTGCNSGIGYDAAVRMAARGHKIVMACRTDEKARDAAARVSGDVPGADVIPAACDLANLDSVRSFVEGIKPALGEAGGVDALCLNAGLARNTAAKEVLRTMEGFELTVGTNHLGHFYLCNLILPQVSFIALVVSSTFGFFLLSN